MVSAEQFAMSVALMIGYGWFLLEDLNTFMSFTQLMLPGVDARVFFPGTGGSIQAQRAIFAERISRKDLLLVIKSQVITALDFVML